MSTSRDVYEQLVGTESGMGVGDFKDFFNKQIDNAVDRVIDGERPAISEEQAEEVLRELADLIATEDEFDADEPDEDEDSLSSVDKIDVDLADDDYEDPPPFHHGSGDDDE